MIAIFRNNPTVILTVFASWSLLIVWHNSAAADLLNHGDWTAAGLLATICGVDLAAGSPSGTALLIVGWILMVLAMMLPASMAVFSCRPTASGETASFNRLIPIALFGYLIPWLGFGIAAHSLGFLINELAKLSIWWSINGWITGAGVLALAGIYQLTAMKRRFLNACCHTLEMQKGHFESIGTLTAMQTVKLGFVQGINCVLCCGPLMLLMFIFWPGSLIWMMALTLIMIADRQTVFDLSVRELLGLLMIITSLVIILANLT